MYTYAYDTYIGSTSEDEIPIGDSSAGFEKLNLQTFEKFGKDIHTTGTEEPGREDVRRAVQEETLSAETTEKEKEEEEEAQEGLQFKGVDVSSSEVPLLSRAKIQRAASTGNVKPLSLPPLKKWDDLHSLERIGESSDGGTQLNSVLEEDEDEKQRQRDKEDLHDRKSTSKNIEEFGSSAVYYKEAAARERSGPEMEVLKRISQIEEGGGMVGGVRGERVRGGRVGLEVVKSGSVNEKLKVFGGGGRRKITRTMSDGRAAMPELVTTKREKYNVHTNVQSV